MIRRFCSLRVTMLAAFAVLSPSLAQPPAGAAQPATAFHETAHVTVRYDDLDLGRPAGVVQLYRRLQKAAEMACGPSQRSGSRIVEAAWKACTAQTLAAAVASVDRPLLTTYHVQRTGATASAGVVARGR